MPALLSPYGGARARRLIAALICCAVLAVKVLVPPGYMLAPGHGSMTVTLCSGVASSTVEVSIPFERDDNKQRSDQHQMPCAFSSLAFPALHGADSIQLALLRVFILGAALLGIVHAAHVKPPHLRPPLRGPPLHL